MTMMTKSSMNNPISQKFQSPFLKPRNKSKSKSKSKSNKQEEEEEEEEEEEARVLDQEELVDYDDDDVTVTESLGFKTCKDLVWAKASPHTWWPGYKTREYRGKFLISFFNSDNKQLWFHDSELKDFEGDFEEMIERKRREKLEPEAVDSALAEFGKRLSVELEAGGFEAGDVLKFVRRVGANSAYGETEAVEVVKEVAFVNAFRRFAFIKRDWIYDETMRVEEYEEIMRVAHGEDGSQAVLKENYSNWIKGTLSRQVGEEEKEVELERGEEVQEEGEGTLKEIWKQVKKNKETLEQEYFIERAETSENEVFQPMEALAFVPAEMLAKVRRLGISPRVNDREIEDVSRIAAQVTRFRRYTRLAGSSNEFDENTKKTHFEEDLRGSVSQKVVEEDGEVVEEHEAELEHTEELAEEGEGTLKAIWEQVKKVSVTKKNRVSLDAGVFTVDEKRVVQAMRLSDDKAENGQEPIFEGVGSGSVIGKAIIEDPLRDILNHLFCLALDPFYLGAKSYSAKCVDATCQKILRYKKKVYQSPTLRRSLYQDSVAETSNVHESSEGCSPLLHHDLSVDIPVKENSYVINNEVNHESERLSDFWSKRKKRPRVGEKTEGIKVNCSISNAADVVIGLVRDNGDFNHESENRKRLKHEDVDSCLSFHNIDGKDTVDFTKDVPELDGRFESNKRQKIEVFGRKNVKGEDGFDVSRDIPDRNRVPKSNKRQKIESVKEYGRSNVKGEDEVEDFRDIPDCNLVSKSNKRQKISIYESNSRLQGGSTETPEGRNSVPIHDDVPGSNLSLHVSEDHLNNEHCSEAGTSGRNVNRKVGCRSDHVFGSLPDGTLCKEIIGNKQEDMVGGAFSQGPACDQVAPDNIGIQLNSGAADDLSNRVLRVGKNHAVRSEKSANLSEYSNKRVARLQEPKILQPLTMLYLSPLSAEKPATGSNPQSQFRKADAYSELPATLHMKFPKDYKLPSKDELVKKFRPFGPIDYLKTKVFFYTGSAQVGFLQLQDAEAACDYAKKKNIFVGGANIRFWLDQRELSRSRTKDVSAPSSLPMATSSVSDLRPCLKVSNNQGNKVDRKDLRVKFPFNGQVLPSNGVVLPSNAQVFPSVSVKTKNEVLSQSDSCRYSNAVSPDISLEMIQLLEKCNQTVTKIKDSLGLQSFYSLFTHQYCRSGFDEG